MQAPIPKATLLQGLRPNLNEGDHCVFPLGSGWGKFCQRGEVHLISRGNASVRNPNLLYFTTPWVGNANSAPQLFF